jgi:uncharacterized protein YqeY
MLLKDRINADFMEAYKAKDMMKKNFLGVLKGAIQTQEGKNIESTDENVLKVIKSMEKGILENIEGRKQTGLDITEQELELKYIKSYQPEMMSDDEIRAILMALVNRPIFDTNDPLTKKLAFTMGMFNKENRGGKPFDNNTVSKIIKEILQ